LFAGPMAAYSPGRQHVFDGRSLVPLVAWLGVPQPQFNRQHTPAVFAAGGPGLISPLCWSHRRPSLPAFSRCQVVDSAPHSLKFGSKLFRDHPAAPCDHAKVLLTGAGLELAAEHTAKLRTEHPPNSLARKALKHDKPQNPKQRAQHTAAGGGVAWPDDLSFAVRSR